MTLSEKIKLLRTNNEMTQPELADKAGIEQSYLSKLENDKCSPSFNIINKVAGVFDMSGMELINTLSQTYVEKNLSHIPEVTAEFASIKSQQIKKFKRGYVLATLLVALGGGLFFYGVRSAWIFSYDFLYQSEGIFKSGETHYQFSKNQIKEIGESEQEYLARIKANRSRLDMKQMITDGDRGEMFVVEVEGGHRLFMKQDSLLVEKTRFFIISALGVMLMVMGVFAFLFNSKFKFTSIDQR
jgi:transcriptional regulator with XRE-family HTH domain